MARDLFWVGSAQKDFGTFPDDVRREMSHALRLAQNGEKAENAKPLKGFSGAQILEIIERDRSGTYRCIYAVKFQTGIYALHAFQKKSHHGIATPQEHIEMIKRQLKFAAEMDAETIAREQRRKRLL